MDTIHLKKMLDTCFLAKKIVETLPELPKGMKPRHIHVLDAVYEMTGQKGSCTVSDVRDYMNITMPSISKLLQELEGFGLLQKQPVQEDKRYYQLTLTQPGMDCVKKHVTDFHQEWVSRLSHIDNQQVEETLYLFQELKDTMPGGEQS